MLIVGLLSACGVQPTESPASPPTELPAATDTSEPAAESSPTAEASAGGTTVSFANAILPLIQSRCINCHGGDRTEEELSLKTYADVMAGSKNGAVVTPGDAADSLLAEMVTNQKMPKRGPKLTPPQVQLIVDWINQGALDN
jgi:Planctomycete cytochrome C.